MRTLKKKKRLSGLYYPSDVNAAQFVVANNITSNTYRRAIDAFCISAKGGSNFWSLTDQIFLMCWDFSTALKDIKGGTALTAVNMTASDFSQDGGFRFDGSTQFLEGPNVQSLAQFTQSSNSMRFFANQQGRSWAAGVSNAITGKQNFFSFGSLN